MGMGTKRWPVVVAALGMGGMLFAPDADADVTHDRVVTSFAGGGAHAFVVEPTTRATITLTTTSYVRVRRQGTPYETIAKIDENDPWTGEPVPYPRIPAPTLDTVDPWNGQQIVVPGGAVAQLEDEHPFDRGAD